MLGQASSLEFFLGFWFLLYRMPLDSGLLCYETQGKNIICEMSVSWSSLDFVPSWIQFSCLPQRRSSKDNVCDQQHEQF